MPVEFFSVPILPVTEGFGATRFKVKYWDDVAVASQGSIRYSWDASCLLMLNATQTYLDFVAAQSDVYRFCAFDDLTEQIGGPASVAISNWLEPLGIPTQWVNANSSYREVLRGIVGMFEFTMVHERQNQRGFFPHLEAEGFDLNTRWQNLSQPFRDSIQANINHWGWPDQPADNDLVRALLRVFAEKFEGTHMEFNGVEI